MTYTEYISQFSIVDNPSEQPPDGFHYHHIVPRCIQTETDNRCVLLKYSEHGYAHWLFDKENDTWTSNFFVGRIHKSSSEISGYEDFKILDTHPWVSESTRHKMSVNRSGEGNGMYGHTHTKEAKDKISNKAKVRLSIPENNPNFGKHHSEETKKKISEANKGQIPWNTGLVWSEETRKKIGQAIKDNSGTRGKHWFHKGEIQVLAYECPEGYLLGKSPEVVKKTGDKLKGRVPWNKGLKSSN